MQIDYDENTDTLFIRFNDAPLIKDVFYNGNTNVSVGMTQYGLGQIKITNVKMDGLLPIQIPERILGQEVKISG